MLSLQFQKLYIRKLKTGRIDGTGGLAPRSVERIHTVIYAALESAVDNDLIGKNVA